MKTRPSVLPTSLDEAFVNAVDAVTKRVLGRTDVAGEALVRALAALSEAYTGAQKGARAPIDLKHTSNDAALAARARFFFVRDLPKISGPLEELRFAKKLPSSRVWRVLDVGAGLGAMSFGIAHFARVHDLADRLDVLAIDHDARAMSFVRELAKETRGGALAHQCCEVHAEVRALDITDKNAWKGLGDFDLIVFGFTLNELFEGHPDEEAIAQRLELLKACATLLRHDASMIVLEPALKDVSRSLQRMRDRFTVEESLTVFAPCVRRGACPMLAGERDWCHESIPYALPARTKELAQNAGLRFEGLSFSYLTLRKDGARLADAFAPGERVLLRAVSDPLPSKGKHELYGCGEPGRVRLMLLDRDLNDTNEAFAQLWRSDLFTLPQMAPSSMEPSEIKHKIAKDEPLSAEKRANDPLDRQSSL